MMPRRSTSAFSLIEVLCAILVLGVGLVGLTQGLTTALSSSKESELQTGATLIAAARIELLRAEGYLVDGTDEGEVEEGSVRYRWEQIVRTTEIDGLHEVKLIVRDGFSSKPLYELQTLLFDPPLTSTETPQSREQERQRQRRGR